MRLKPLLRATQTVKQPRTLSKACFRSSEFSLTVYYGRRHHEREAGCCLRQAQAAFAPAASSLAELVEASEDTAPPTVLTLAMRGQSGVDSLARGTEAEPGTFIEDTVSMAALAELPPSILQILACIGFGAEREVTHTHILENIADLTQRGAFYGACALTKAMAEYQAYEAAVIAVHEQPFQDPSVINASIISAVRGEYGNYHLTEKTQGSRLWISPLMSLYWFFDFPTVVAQNAIRASLATRRTLSLRRSSTIPL